MVPQFLNQIKGVKFNSVKEFIIENADNRYEEKLIRLSWCQKSALRFELKQKKKVDENIKQDSNTQSRIVEKLQQFVNKFKK